MVTRQAWELRADDGRAVLSGADHSELDPRGLPIDAELADSLHEWASVAGVVRDSTPAAATLIANRGRQLAGKLAAATGSVVVFTDPVTGERLVLQGQPVAEPTPWATGIAVSGFAMFIVVFAMITLSLALGEISEWLAFAANLVITFGLAPTIALIKTLRVWRWVAYGCTAGIAAGWLAWLATLL